MLIKVLKSKIQQITVTESSVNYPGSISLPEELLVASRIRQFELVYVNNKTNGNRIVTYVIKNNSKGEVTINGAASKLFNKGDTIHILAFAYLQETELDFFSPILVIADESNNVIKAVRYS